MRKNDSGFFGGLFGWGGKRRRKKAGKSSPKGGRRPRIEHLESRQLLSVTWTGGAGDGQFNTPGNWSANLVPGASDDVVIPANAGTINLANSVTVNSIEFVGNATLQASSAAVNLTMNSGVIQVDSGTACVSVAIVGGLIEQGPGTLNLSGANSYSSGTTVTTGTLVASSAGAIPQGSSLTVGAELSFGGPSPSPGNPPFQRQAPDILAPDATPDISSADVVYANGSSLLSASDLGLGTTRSYSSYGGQLAPLKRSGGLGFGLVADRSALRHDGQRNAHRGFL